MLVSTSREDAQQVVVILDREGAQRMNIFGGRKVTTAVINVAVQVVWPQIQMQWELILRNPGAWQLRNAAAYRTHYIRKSNPDKPTAHTNTGKMCDVGFYRR